MPDLPHRNAPGARRSKARRLAHERMLLNAFALDWEGERPWDVRALVPEAWATLEQDIDVEEKKAKVTLWLDESVAKFFRAQGKGYQARINRVLATYAQMKIGEVNMSEDLLARHRAAE